MKLTHEKRNTIVYMHNLFKDFYTQRKQYIKIKKYKLLQRWARYSERVQNLDRTEPILQARLNRLDKEFQFISPKLQELHDIHINEHMMKSVLNSKDFSYYIRNKVYELATRKRLDRFYSKLNWMAYNDRFEYLKTAVRNNKSLLQLIFS